MTDRELLERAANAAGLTIRYWNPTGWADVGPINDWWNPLTDDGDALRLAVKLGIELRDPYQYNKACAYARETMHEFWEDLGTEPYAATRRAIVRAAAAMAGE